MTLGFRGEALPSIAAVSRVEMTSKNEGDSAGISLSLEGGRVVREKDVGRPRGTAIRVLDLFYNTPARRKFLRSPATELRRIVEEVTAFSLAHPQVFFRLVSDSGEVLSTPAVQNRRDRLAQVFGREFTEGLLPARGEMAGVSLDGFVAKPELGRATRDEQYLFMNNRHIQSRVLLHAVHQGYGPQISEKHPPVFLFLTVDPGLVDVNVHPTKREVRFSNESHVYELILHSVRDALGNAGLPAPGEEHRPSCAVREASDLHYAGAEQVRLDLPESAPPSGTISPQESTLTLTSPPIVLWQLHNTYVFAQVRGGMVIIDQHAAHERVLFEEMLGRGSSVQGQQLLFPEVLELSPSEWMVYEEYVPVLQELGFTMRHFGGKTVVVEAIPASLKRLEGSTVIHDTLKELSRTGVATDRRLETLAASLACKSAIKAGDPLTLEEMNLLVDQLYATEIPYTCPHGRPTMFKMTLEELGRKFGRG